MSHLPTIPLEEIARIIGLQLGVRQVKGSDHILHDLAAESVDIVNFIATIEEKYDIFIDETTLAAVGTVAELHELVLGLTAENNHQSTTTEHVDPT